MSSTRVLSEQSLHFLEKAGNSITLHRGVRTISLQTISSYDSDDTIDVPDMLNSPESLEFCGLQTEVAKLLHQKWEHDEQTLEPYTLGYGATLISIARHYIRGMADRKNALWEQDDWDDALESMGINELTRSRILDPTFKDLRLSRSAAEWALDTLDRSWEYLDGLDARLKKLKEEKETRSGSPDSSVKPLKAKRPSDSLTSALHSGSSSLKLAVETEVPKEVPGRILLHKGGGWTRLISIFNPDGSLNVRGIASQPPVDFHPWHKDLYFTKQWDVALHYSNFAQRRVPPDTATILTVAVPSSFTASLLQVFGDDWKKLVWHSRNEGASFENYGSLPKELAKYEEADVLIGLICGVGHDQIQRLKSPDDLENLKISNGERATQVVLQGQEMLNKFKEECRGYVWVAPVASPNRAKHFPPT